MIAKVLASGLVLIGLAVFANEEIKPRVMPKRFGVVIEDALYRSGRIHSDILPQVIQQHGIDTIVTLTKAKEGHAWQEKERDIAREQGVDLYRFPLRGDGTGDPESYIAALARIHEEISQGRQVLVHCAAGTQRTGGTVFLYRALFQEMDPDEAVAEMTRYDFDPADNPALLPYLRAHLPQIRQALRQQTGLKLVLQKRNGGTTT